MDPGEGKMEILNVLGCLGYKTGITEETVSFKVDGSIRLPL